MKRETAEKIAAAETGVEFQATRKVIAAFLAALVECPVCQGAHRFTYQAQVEVPVTDSGR